MKKYCLLILLVYTTYMYGQFQPEEWPVICRYDVRHIGRIAMPIGGIGTGDFSLGGNGRLLNWEIMNVPAIGFNGTNTGNNAPFFAVHVESAHIRKTKALIGPIYDADYYDFQGRSVDHQGLPRFENAEFLSAYPFGQVKLSDKKMPIDVVIKAFNPLIPGDEDASSIPVGVITYEVHNKTEQEVAVSVCGNMRNFVGKDGSVKEQDWDGNWLAVGTKSNQNIFKQGNNISGIYMYSDSVDVANKAWGNICLATEENNVTYKLSSKSRLWEGCIDDYWADFSEDGLLTPNDVLADNDPMASLSVRKMIAPNKKVTFTFYISWYFPNRYAWSSEKVGNYYCSKYKNSWDVLQKQVPQMKQLEQKTLLFVNTLLNSSYPDYVKKVVLCGLASLRTQTVFRIGSGHLMGWEGIFYNHGSCPGSCTHVWSYEMAIPFLFGNLSKTMRDVEFNYAMDENGLMSFRAGLPLYRANEVKTAAADGQMSTILRFYRDWHLSGDKFFLKNNWEKIKLAMNYAWLKGGWDGDQDGLMEGVQHNTYDQDWVGPNPLMQLWYLGALRAAEEMALVVNDKNFASKCRRIYTTGSKLTDKHLFNGEYYIQKIGTPYQFHELALGTAVSIKNQDFLMNPYYQLGEGCLIDQLVGQFMANICSLGHLVNPQNIQKTLQSIMKYNYKATLEDYFNYFRAFAMEKDAGTIMTSWPYGKPKNPPFPFSPDIWTGSEYAVAALMIDEGMEEEGLEIIKSVSLRKDGNKRNPFSEEECGFYYIRALSSWATILSLSGFHYSGVNQSISFNQKAGCYFWSNGYAWGKMEKKIKNNSMYVSLYVLSGDLPLKEVKIGKHKPYVLKQTVVLNEGQKLDFVIKL